MSDPCTTHDKTQQKASLLDLSPADKLLSPFQRAAEMKCKASTIGFDWRDVDHLLEHAQDELNEIREAVKEGDTTHIQDEMGDLLFVLANLARFTGTSADEALLGAMKKFETRFRCLENLMSERGLSPETADLGALWKEAKIKTSPA